MYIKVFVALFNLVIIFKTKKQKNKKEIHSQSLPGGIAKYLLPTRPSPWSPLSPGAVFAGGYAAVYGSTA